MFRRREGKVCQGIVDLSRLGRLCGMLHDDSSLFVAKSTFLCALR